MRYYLAPNSHSLALIIEVSGADVYFAKEQRTKPVVYIFLIVDNQINQVTQSI